METRRSGRGLVLAVDRAGAGITISHDAIPGFMDAMVMPFKVANQELLRGVESGQQIYFRLAVEKTRSYIDHLRILSPTPADPARWQSPVRSHLVRTGDPVPGFELADDDGEMVRMGDLRGKVVALTFFYSRCPLPDYCPRMTANFAELARRFAARLGKELVLLSITIDPQHDTVPVLKKYAARQAAADGWRFLTGDLPEITRISGFFGLEFWPDQGAILHNLQTAIIDRDGKLAANTGGRSYSPRQLGDLVESLLN